MAQYRLSAAIISRSEGKSVIAAAAYRSGNRLLDERTGYVKDYSRRAWSVLYTRILTPENAPEWMHDRQRLWNGVEHREDRSTKRSTAQLARDIELSLPCELTHEQRVELVCEFVKAEFVDRGMVADMAIHAPPRRGDGTNHHAHVLLTMRHIKGDGFGLKNRAWNDDELLEHWRESWEVYQNRALEKYGFDAHVDHRSLKDQGIDREPTKHLGPGAQQLEDQGIHSERGDENRRIKEANDNLELLKQELGESEQRLAELKRQLAAERMERIEKIVGAADAVWEKIEESQAAARRLQNHDSPPYYPEDSTVPASDGGKAASMPDDHSEIEKLRAQPEADDLQKQVQDAEQARQDQAGKDEEKRQEEARKIQDRLQQELVAADDRLKELGRIYREAEEHRQQLIRQAEELEKLNARYEDPQSQPERERLPEQNPVDAYLRDNHTAIEDFRQELLDKVDKLLEGDIRNPHTRYTQALQQHYEYAGNPYEGLANAALAEHATFRSEQDALTTEIAKTGDPKLRESLEIQRQIEGYEYLMITSERIAVQSEIITGRKNSDQAVLMRERINGRDILDEDGNKIGFEDGYRQKAQQLRQEYRELKSERMAERIAEKEQAQSEPLDAREREPGARRPETQPPNKYDPLDAIIKKVDDEERERENQQKKERERQQERGRER